MDNNNLNTKLLSSVQHIKKSARKTNKSCNKTKPLKVVYISNPMKIKTSVSQFRALVQELTGRDSKFPIIPTEERDSTTQIQGSLDLGLDQHHQYDLCHQSVKVSGKMEQPCESNNSSCTTNTTNNSAAMYEMFENDDVFMPQAMDGFTGILPPSVWYDSIHVQLCD